MSETEDAGRPRPPAWVVLALINLASLGVVAALVGLSVLVDELLFDLG